MRLFSYFVLGLCLLSLQFANADQLSSGEAQAATSAPQVKTLNLKGEKPIVFAEAPIRASKDRVAIFVRGGDNDLLRLAYKAAQTYSSEHGGAQTYMLYAEDNDADPDTAEIEAFGDGMSYDTLVVGNLHALGKDKTAAVRIEQALTKLMDGAHQAYLTD